MSKPVICPHCQRNAVFIANSAPIYGGRDYGPRYICWSCDAHVGCHPGTTDPLGAPATKAEREARQRAHAAFDPIWKNAPDRRYRAKQNARKDAYAWLRNQMGLGRDQCHIGMFTVEQCARVVELCRERASPAFKDPPVAVDGR